MIAPTKNSLFKAGVPARDKAENTTSAARMIADAEVAARKTKTAKLRTLRLKKEAEEQAAAPEPVVKAKRSPAKTKAKT